LNFVSELAEFVSKRAEPSGVWVFAQTQGERCEEIRANIADTECEAVVC